MRGGRREPTTPMSDKSYPEVGRHLEGAAWAGFFLTLLTRIFQGFLYPLWQELLAKARSFKRTGSRLGVLTGDSDNVVPIRVSRRVAEILKVDDPFERESQN